MAGLNVDNVRANFPALVANPSYIFADSAGGSQCLKTVIDNISDYLSGSNVQLGANYSVSQQSTSRVALGPECTAKLINAASADEIVFGSSSTLLAHNLAAALDADILDGEEIIVTGEHESNVGPWKKLAARRGLTIKTWYATQLPSASTPEKVNPYGVALALDALTPLITSRTRLVAFTACSNILGSVVDVPGVVQHIREIAKAKGARKVEVCVDCVAYAPHRRIDVRGWDVDYAFWSYYKVYGPHTSVMYVRSSSLTNSLSSLAHHFLAVDSKPYKLQPGGPGYELVYGSTAVLPYLESLGDGNLDTAFTRIAAHEQKLLEPLMGYLTSDEAWNRGVRLVGSSEFGLGRVPTVSFVVTGQRAMRSPDVVSGFDKTGNMGIRYGHFYAYTLVESFTPKLNLDDGIVRISLVHYNTVDEVEKLVAVLKEVLA